MSTKQSIQESDVQFFYFYLFFYTLIIFFFFSGCPYVRGCPSPRFCGAYPGTNPEQHTQNNKTTLFFFYEKEGDSQVPSLFPTLNTIIYSVEHIWAIMERITIQTHNSRTYRYNGSRRLPFIKSPPQMAVMGFELLSTWHFFFFIKMKKTTTKQHLIRFYFM